VDPLFICRLLAGSIALLGVVAMFGWFARVPALVQIGPGLAAMTFATALCFLLTGVGLLPSFFRHTGRALKCLSAAPSSSWRVPCSSSS